MKLLLLIASVLLLSALTGLIFTGLLLLSALIKKKREHMDEQAWSRYFRSLDDTDLLRRILFLFLPSLLIVCFIAYFVFLFMGFRYSVLWAFVVVAFESGKVLFRYRKKKTVLSEKFRRLREG